MFSNGVWELEAPLSRRGEGWSSPLATTHQKLGSGCPSLALPSNCQVSRAMVLGIKRTDPSHRQTFTPPGCSLRAVTIPVQLSQAKPAPPVPTPPWGPICMVQLGGAAVLNNDME